MWHQHPSTQAPTLPAKLATATKFMHILFSDRIHKLTSFSGVCCLVRFKVNDRTGGGVFLYESIGCMQSEWTVLCVRVCRGLNHFGIWWRHNNPTNVVGLYAVNCVSLFTHLIKKKPTAKKAKKLYTINYIAYQPNKTGDKKDIFVWHQTKSTKYAQTDNQKSRQTQEFIELKNARLIKQQSRRQKNILE